MLTHIIALMLDVRKLQVTLIAIQVIEQWSADNKLLTVTIYIIFSIISLSIGNLDSENVYHL